MLDELKKQLNGDKEFVQNELRKKIAELEKQIEELRKQFSAEREQMVDA